MSLAETFFRMDDMHLGLLGLLIFTNFFWWFGYRGLKRYVSALEGWRDDHINRVKAGMASYAKRD